jgi:hypothetical protein
MFNILGIITWSNKHLFTLAFTNTKEKYNIITEVAKYAI